jgi:hypothetical protein
MKYVKLERPKLWRQVQACLVPREGRGCLQVAVRWWILMTQCSETWVIKQHTPGNNPKGYTQHLEQGESFKSRGNVTSKVTSV